MTIRAATAMAAVVLSVFSTPAQTAQRQSKTKVGDSYDVVLTRKSVKQGPGESSSGTDDVDAIVERIVAVSDGGVVLAIDLAAETPAGDRASQWQLPARVFVPVDGAPRLLNREELERRIDPWLKLGGMTRAACGHLIFTWNVFRIECDPESALSVLTTFDLQPRDLRDGAPFADPTASGTAHLVRLVDRANVVRFAAEMAIDPEAIRRERAKTDVGVGELRGKPVSLDAALHARAGEAVTGTVRVTFEADAAGQVKRRTRLIRYTVTSPGKEPETHIVTETLERKRLA